MNTWDEFETIDGLDEDNVGEMDVWKLPGTTRRKCQHCKQTRDCRQGPDPYLYYSHDEIEEVWLCAECFFLRGQGDHLPDEEEDWDEDYPDDEDLDDEDEDYEDDDGDDYDDEDEDDEDYDNEEDYDDHDQDDDE